MDPDAIGREARAAANTAANQTAQLPRALNELRGNLNAIFQKDNPLVQERQAHLENFLSAKDNLLPLMRSSLLQNVPHHLLAQSTIRTKRTVQCKWRHVLIVPYCFCSSSQPFRQTAE